MSNIFLNASILYLAREEAGCIDDEGEFIEDCEGKAYGFKPATFVANIAVIASVLAALLMPVIGAMVDYTAHRKRVGVVVSALMILIQLVQIETVSKTWLPMAILQAFSGFLYQALILAVFAYLPEMSYRLDEDTMTDCECCITAQMPCATDLPRTHIFVLSTPSQYKSIPDLSCPNSFHNSRLS